MSIKDKVVHIGFELKGHAPFTLLGAAAGILFMLIFKAIGKPSASTLFTIFHPGHVVLSAMVTSSMFGIHRKGKNFLLVFLVGYFGSIGVATLSDSIIPYFGESILGVSVPSHAKLHEHEINGGDEKIIHEHGTEGQEVLGHTHEGDAEVDMGHEDAHEGKTLLHRIHIGFIEDWYIVNPAALLGIAIAYLLPRTKFPHAGHILISTWASSSHILMNTTEPITAMLLFGMFIVLFIAVWLPCCVSDIVFPLLFVKSDIRIESSCPCHDHSLHSHRHIRIGSEQENEE